MQRDTTRGKAKSLFRTHIPQLNLRFATADDAALVLDFIRQLAQYENLLPEVTADERTLQKSLFGDRPVAEVILAEYQGKPAGFALFFHNFSTFLGKPGIYIEDLFIKPACRGQGLGKAMLVFLAGLAVERDCGRLEWWVLDWNKEAIGFYEKMGAEAMDEWTVFRISGERLMKLAGDKI